MLEGLEFGYHSFISNADQFNYIPDQDRNAGVSACRRLKEIALEDPKRAEAQQSPQSLARAFYRALDEEDEELLELLIARNYPEGTLLKHLKKFYGSCELLDETLKNISLEREDLASLQYQVLCNGSKVPEERKDNAESVDGIWFWIDLHPFVRPKSERE